MKPRHPKPGSAPPGAPRAPRDTRRAAAACRRRRACWSRCIARASSANRSCPRSARRSSGSTHVWPRSRTCCSMGAPCQGARCGAPVFKGTHFCPNCGRRRESAASTRLVDTVVCAADATRRRAGRRTWPRWSHTSSDGAAGRRAHVSAVRRLPPRSVRVLRRVRPSAFPSCVGAIPSLRRRWVRRIGWYLGRLDSGPHCLPSVLAAAGTAAAIVVTHHRARAPDPPSSRPVVTPRRGHRRGVDAERATWPGRRAGAAGPSSSVSYPSPKGRKTALGDGKVRAARAKLTQVRDARVGELPGS